MKVDEIGMTATDGSNGRDVVARFNSEEGVYVLSWHDGEMPTHYVETYGVFDDLIARMREIASLQEWQSLEEIAEEEHAQAERALRERELEEEWMDLLLRICEDGHRAEGKEGGIIVRLHPAVGDVEASYSLVQDGAGETEAYSLDDYDALIARMREIAPLQEWHSLEGGR